MQLIKTPVSPERASMRTGASPPPFPGKEILDITIQSNTVCFDLLLLDGNSTMQRHSRLAVYAFLKRNNSLYLFFTTRQLPMIISGKIQLQTSSNVQWNNILFFSGILLGTTLYCYFFFKQNFYIDDIYFILKYNKR